MSEIVRSRTLCLRMNRIYNMVWGLCILRWILLCSRFQAADFVTDTECYDNCNCCKNKSCHTNAVYGWTNVCIDGCIDHHRGVRCYELCTYNCTTCNNNKDICTECFEGFYPGSNKDCTSKCPTNCKACTSNIMCTACKNGYYNKEGSTTCPYALCPAKCLCSGINCTTCKIGFYDTGNECSKECPPNCMSCSSRELCNECKHGFYNGYEFDNNVRQLHNNCTFKCRDECTKCLSYDNCLQCVKGKYGLKCQNNCSVGCKDQTCQIGSGTCDCSSNFVGDKCDECVEGKYGIYCNKNCSSFCQNSTCDKNSGHCRDCMKNHYGPLCSEICSENCNASQNSDSSYCASSDGTCIYGCKIGFFGRTCNEKCSCYCIDNVCKKDSGVCLKGCTGSYQDPACGFSFGKSDDASTTTPTNIVLATLLALTTTALSILILWIIVRKTRSTVRQTGDSLCQIPEHSLAVNQTSQNQSVVGLSEADNTAYEVLDRTEGAPEHTYETASPTAPKSTVNSGNTEYLNLQIQKS